MRADRADKLLFRCVGLDLEFIVLLVPLQCRNFELVEVDRDVRRLVILPPKGRRGRVPRGLPLGPPADGRHGKRRPLLPPSPRLVLVLLALALLPGGLLQDRQGVPLQPDVRAVAQDEPVPAPQPHRLLHRALEPHELGLCAVVPRHQHLGVPRQQSRGVLADLIVLRRGPRPSAVHEVVIRAIQRTTAAIPLTSRQPIQANVRSAVLLE
mmetsp:Transcript_1299/g.3769  ORF Transcript_1299/g.3769 Transcript_1299/m.3769 type:complete len:210 (-) Transcript_1299:533-1162(-)